MPTGPMMRCRVIVTGVDGSPYYLTMHFDESGSDATNAMADWFALVGGSGVNNKAGSTYSVDRNVAIIDPVSGDQTGEITIPAVAPIVGTNSAKFLPPATQLLFKWRTQLFVSGRRLQGRTSIPLRPESESDNAGNPSGGTLTSATAAVNAFVAKTTSSPVIYSRTSGQWASIQTSSVWNKYAVLRSRRD